MKRRKFLKGSFFSMLGVGTAIAMPKVALPKEEPPAPPKSNGRGRLLVKKETTYGEQPSSVVETLDDGTLVLDKKLIETMHFRFKKPIDISLRSNMQIQEGLTRSNMLIEVHTRQFIHWKFDKFVLLPNVEAMGLLDEKTLCKVVKKTLDYRSGGCNVLELEVVQGEDFSFG